MTKKICAIINFLRVVKRDEIKNNGWNYFEFYKILPLNTLPLNLPLLNSPMKFSSSNFNFWQISYSKVIFKQC